MLELHIDSLIPSYIPYVETLPLVFEVHVLLEAFCNVAGLVGWLLVLDQYGTGCFFLESIHLAAL